MEYTPNTGGPDAQLIRKARRASPLSRLEIKLKYKAAFLLPDPLMTPQSIYNYCMAIWDIDSIEIQEEFVAIFLNNALNVLGHRKISRGGNSSTQYFPGLVTAIALNCMASGVVVVHNHPSKNAKPSFSDMEATEKLREGLDLFGIRLHDHVIISRDGYYSMANAQLLYSKEKNTGKKASPG